MDALSLVENAELQGTHLSASLRELQDEYRFIGDVRGNGLLTTIEVTQDRSSRAPFPERPNLSSRFVADAMQGGLILYERRTRGGYWGDHVMICPPLIATKGDIETIVSRLKESLEQTKIWIGSHKAAKQPLETSGLATGD